MVRICWRTELLMLQGLAKSICVSAKKGSAADVTPNAVDWNNVSGGYGLGLYTNTVTITGIDTAINLVITWSGNDGGDFVIVINGTIFSLEASGGSPRTFSISNNDTIRFGAGGAASKTISVTVTNASNGNAVLDTFIIGYLGEE